VPPECARPRAQRRPPIVAFRNFPASWAARDCCARGRAHSGPVAFGGTRTPHLEIPIVPHTPVLAASAFAGLTFGARAANTGALPNIIIIITDDQGYADVGVFGAKGFHTPNLDRMAMQGCVFRNFHVPQPVCSASRAGLLTGCYPNASHPRRAAAPHQGRHQQQRNDPGGTAPAARLCTAIFGKWHLGDSQQFLPLQHGFDEYFGLPYSNDMWPLPPTLSSCRPMTKGGSAASRTSSCSTAIRSPSLRSPTRTRTSSPLVCRTRCEVHRAAQGRPSSSTSRTTCLTCPCM